MDYRGYMGSVEFSLEDDILYGSLAGIRDSVSYHGKSIDELRVAFEEAVDDYLDMCAAEGLQPDSPFNGILDVTIAPSVYKQLIIYSAKNNQQVNHAVEEAIKKYVSA